MSYLLTLNASNSERLKTLSKNKGLMPPELIKRVIVDYLNSCGGESPSSTKASPELEVQDLAGVTNLFRWDEKRGVVVFTHANRRLFILNARSWDAVEADLIARIPKEAGHLISGMGAAYGRAAALDYRSVTGNPADVASYFEHLGLAAGWGKFALTGELAKGSNITVRVYDCVFCRTRSVTGGRKDPCHFIIGVCRGIANTVYDSSHYVQETKCSAAGSEFCEFRIRKAADPEMVWSVNTINGLR
jgi:predicted hydrocarbon binding protein